jgi:isoleucyl-tRNA synthetase
MVRELHALARCSRGAEREAVRWATSGDALVTLERSRTSATSASASARARRPAAQAVAALGAEAIRAFEHGETVLVNVDGAEHALQPDDLAVLRRASGEYAVAGGGRVRGGAGPRAHARAARRGHGARAREPGPAAPQGRRAGGQRPHPARRARARGGRGGRSGASGVHRGRGAGDRAPGGRRGRPRRRRDPAAAAGAEGALPSAVTRTVDLDGSAVHVSLSKDTV